MNCPADPDSLQYNIGRSILRNCSLSLMDGVKMVKIYQPSGKLSLRFLPELFLTALCVVFPCSLAYHWLSGLPVRKLLCFSYLLCAAVMEYLAQFRVVRKGKVRNTRVAVIAAILLSLEFAVLVILQDFWFYQQTRNLWPVGAWDFLQFIYTFGSRLLPKFLILFIPAAVWMGAGFVASAKKPFCEACNRWAAEHTILCETSMDETTLLQQMFLCDTSFFHTLRRLQKANANHLELTLWEAGNQTVFYLTIESKTAKIGRRGNCRYASKELVRYLMIDREIGKMLLSLEQSSQPVSARVIHPTKSLRYVFSDFLQNMASLLFLLLMFGQLKSRFNGMAPISFFVVYGVLLCVMSLLSLIGCFLHENVIRTSGDDSDGKTVWHADIETKDSNIFEKLFYFLLLGGGIFFLYAVLRQYVV